MAGCDGADPTERKKKYISTNNTGEENREKKGLTCGESARGVGWVPIQQVSESERSALNPEEFAVVPFLRGPTLFIFHANKKIGENDTI